MIPTSIDGTDITAATIDGTDVQEITVDGDTVFSATPAGLIDSFEDGNLNEYKGGSFAGGLTNAFVTNAESFDGTRSVTNSATAQYGSNTLNNLPQRGDTYSFRFYYTSNSGTFRWGIAGDDDAGESYGGELSLGSSGADAGKWGSETSNNFFGSLGSFNYSNYRNEWLKCTNERSSNGNISITIEAEDGTLLSTGSLTDGGRSNRNGIAFQPGGSEIYIDFLVNESI